MSRSEYWLVPLPEYTGDRMAPSPPERLPNTRSAGGPTAVAEYADGPDMTELTRIVTSFRQGKGEYGVT